MIKVISIVGRSGIGKTTILEKIIKELTRQGYRIGTIKHDVHSFEIDYPGKDSYRHFHSGSEMSMIFGPRKLALVRRLDKSFRFKQALQMFDTARLDLIITEGFKKEKYPKIEIVRKAISSKPICRVKGDNLRALISDTEIRYKMPQFGFNEIKKITHFIKERFIC